MRRLPVLLLLSVVLVPSTFLLAYGCGDGDDPADGWTDSAAGDSAAGDVLAEDGRGADGSVSDCGGYLAAFSPYLDLVDVSCDEEYLHVHSETGLPWLDPDLRSQQAMVGITSWILRVPIPSDYPWRIPLEPEWSPTVAQASPKGPIAVAINGVPIFHYEARPDGSTLLEDYNAGSDTVTQGELDHCGGHSGQGEDYHYHYAPVCLLDAHDLSQPIAFGLDGAPIYFGTGGTDYYGDGRFNDVDNLPDEPLDDCNAVALADGSFVHYTTAEPPYLIGCHHAVVDPDLSIEPRPMREQGVASPYGGLVGESSRTLVTGFSQDPDGWFQLEHEAFDGIGTSGIRYRASETGDDCWDFDFREDIDVAGTTATYCRPE